MTKRPKKTTPKKKAVRKDVSQTALSVVEQAIGGKLASHLAGNSQSAGSSNKPGTSG
jgi:hypothetical protein